MQRHLLNFLMVFLLVSCQEGPTYEKIQRSEQVASNADASNNGDNDSQDAVGDGSADQGDENASEDPGEEAEEVPVVEETGPATGQVSLSFISNIPQAVGRYTPEHLRSVWITDVNNQHVRTLDANPGRRPQHLRKWREINGGGVDGFTGATITNFSPDPVTLTWDLMNLNETIVDVGTYKLWIEVTESNTNATFVNGSPGYLVHEVMFNLSSQGFNVIDNGNPGFSNVTVTHTP